ncbi:MAG: hypothetical protein WD468_01505 [Pirellulales bacterium]
MSPVGEFWICAEEARARRRLDALERLEVQYRKAQEQVDRRIADNDAAANSAAKKKEEIEAIRKQLAETELTGSDRKQAEEKLKQHVAQYAKLKAQHKSSQRFGEDPAVRQDVVRLVNARTQLGLDVIEIRRSLAELPAAYRRVGADAEIAAAVAALGGRARLGPAKDYSGENGPLARAQRIWASEKTPIYREDQHYRVSSIINERAPATWSLRHSTGPTVIPHSLGVAAGIVPDARTQKTTYLVDPNRRVEVHVVTIDRIDVGGTTLRNVTAYLLPPEGEDLGAKLGKAAYADYAFDIDGSRLQLSVSAQQASAQKAQSQKNQSQKNRSPASIKAPLRMRTTRRP